MCPGGAAFPHEDFCFIALVLLRSIYASSSSAQWTSYRNAISHDTDGVKQQPLTHLL
jgi:hypothetical protein